MSTAALPDCPVSDGVVDGLAVMVMLPGVAPFCAANQILPLASEVIHWIVDPAIGTLASEPSPVLGSITPSLSIVCSANHRLPWPSIVMPKGRPSSLTGGYWRKV